MATIILIVKGSSLRTNKDLVHRYYTTLKLKLDKVYHIEIVIFQI